MTNTFLASKIQMANFLKLFKRQIWSLSMLFSFTALAWLMVGSCLGNNHAGGDKGIAIQNMPSLDVRSTLTCMITPRGGSSQAILD